MYYKQDKDVLVNDKFTEQDSLGLLSDLWVYLVLDSGWIQKLVKIEKQPGELWHQFLAPPKGI